MRGKSNLHASLFEGEVGSQRRRICLKNRSKKRRKKKKKRKNKYEEENRSNGTKTSNRPSFDVRKIHARLFSHGAYFNTVAVMAALEFSHELSSRAQEKKKKKRKEKKKNIDF